MHGNEPGPGAKKDAEIMAEEAEIIRKKQEKTDSLPGKKLNHNHHKSNREEE
jgi:hypothetical protein